MFAVGDNVLYGADGVCTITEHGMRDFFGSTREYYILKPNADPSGTVYVPADNPALVEKMRRLMTKEEIDGILAECAGADNGNGTRIVNPRIGSQTTANGSTPTTKSCKAATASGFSG